MYKVFFKDRIVFFSNNFPTLFRDNSGLFYKYSSKGELIELIDAFYRLNKINRLFLFHEDVDFLKAKFASCFEQIKASGGLVKRNKQEFLMILRDGIWDLPKGKNEPGETSEEAALREVSEECGLYKLSITRKITKTYHAYISDNKPVLKETVWFEMLSLDEQDPVPQEIENITMTSWLRSEDISSVAKNTYLSIIEVLEANKLM